eukprot:gene14025-biopygen3815
MSRGGCSRPESRWNRRNCFLTSCRSRAKRGIGGIDVCIPSTIPRPTTMMEKKKVSFHLNPLPREASHPICISFVSSARFLAPEHL